jgi:uncharacterized protein (DUF302 family)
MIANFHYTVETSKPFDQAVQAIEERTAANGFRVLHTHDVAATLAAKGFPREPLKIVEVCNAKYASEVLKKDINTAFMLPCPITVYTQAGKTFIGTMLPSTMIQFYPEAGIQEIAANVEKVVLQIVNSAK